jgi:predicted peroxiredoxin
MRYHSPHMRSPVPKLLVHIVTGPENPTRAALGFLVARTAAAAGHEVTLFLAGDGVDYLRDETMDAAMGLGTGSIREHYTALSDAGARLYASAMSSKARGIDSAAAGGKPAEFAKPDQLVELILASAERRAYDHVPAARRGALRRRRLCAGAGGGVSCLSQVHQRT